MATTAPNLSSSIRRCNTEHHIVEDRYYLHHHAPDHYHNRRLYTIRQHMSTSSLYQLMQNHASDKDASRTVVTGKFKQRRRKASMSSSQLTAMELPAKRPTAIAPAHMIRSHALIPATCSRLRLACETCQHTVHKHQYLYCRNCPVVCHARDTCLNDIPRDCPAHDLGLEGWGESEWIDFCVLLICLFVCLFEKLIGNHERIVDQLV
ncbi:unnamed protein product [Echinostoma caproni]|uniref:Phorbol-ester/DAG-type domain-containing protein n=1 Tax=Echinostoma caproni TaxID=27848 RepID=A0A183AT97_9TREM|nr:unnamed protein product [Echinostoma caproni]